MEWKLPKPPVTSPSEEEVIGLLRRGVEKSFDPQLVGAFLTVLGRGEELRETELISAVSHELRSPLTFLLGYSELLAHQEDISPEVKERINEIYQESRHMSKIVENLLDLSRWESGRIRPRLEACQLKEVIDHAVAKAQTLTTTHKIEIRLPSPLPLVKADRDQIQQVVDNLLSNAINYSEGGTIFIDATVEKSEMKVCISDQGIGIPQADLERIFDPFYRVQSPLKQKFRGTGLGLSLCRHIIRAHGGKIWAESPGEGKGASFYFTLPLFA